MTAPEPYRLTDVEGDALEVRRHNDGAYIDTDPGGARPSVRIEPHQAAPMCRAIYAACGLPVPDLPEVPDPAEIERIASALRCEIGAVAGKSGQVARALYAHGVRCPEGGESR